MTRRGRTALALALALALTTAVYANHFHNAFHFDDTHTVVNNVFIREIDNIPRFFRDASTFSANPWNQSYRPIVTTTLAIDYRLGGGLEPFFFHLSTFLLFLLQGVLMFLLVRGLFAKALPEAGTDVPALIAAAWYLLHPANAETINYVIARGDSISTLFVVLTVLLYARSPRARRLHLYLLPAALAMLTKPVAAVFAPLLFAYELLFGDAAGRAGEEAGARSLAWRAALRSTAPAFLAAVLLLAFVAAMSPKTWVPGGGSHAAYVMTQPFLLLRYVTTFFLPLQLSADTDLRPISAASDPRFLAGLASLALLAAIATLAARRRRWRPVSFGLWWFLIALAPTSIAFPLAEVTNDHRLFFPYVGLATAVVWAGALALDRPGAARRAPSLRRIALVGAVALLGVYGWGTHRRNEVWRTEESLWRDVTVKSPANGRGWMNYGLALMAQGRYPAAEEALLAALERSPGYAHLHINLGVLLGATGRPAEAEPHFQRALSLAGTLPDPYFFYARFLAGRRRTAEAVPLLQRALELAPAHLEARHLLLAVLTAESDLARLERLAEETLRVAPGDPAARGALGEIASRRAALAESQGRAARERTPEALLELSLQSHRAGDFAGSIRAAEDALLLRPDWAPAYNNICAAYNALRDWDRAVAAGERAVTLDPQNALARNNLAWARSRGGNPPRP